MILKRICTSALLLSSALLSGCSFLFGDTFQDRADNYLTLEPQPELQTPAGQAPLAQRDANVIPPLPVETRRPDKFATPRPLPLVVEPVDDTAVTSLAQYRADSLNPRLDKDGAGTQIPRMDLGYAASWAAVTEALAASDLKLTDLNRSTGTYYLQLEQTDVEDTRSWWGKLWGEELVTSANYLLKMNRSRQGVYLSLLTDADNLADADVTQRVLTEVKNQLDQ